MQELKNSQNTQGVQVIHNMSESNPESDGTVAMQKQLFDDAASLLLLCYFSQ